MRAAAMFLVATTLSIAPRSASAQVTVTSPGAGAASSYRTTVISWRPIPGAAFYHLQIDDDPNFGSPEVDVTVAGTSYRLSGERLKLHGQLSWAAYVRINGRRWNAASFTPSYFNVGQNPALAVDSRNRVYLTSNDNYFGKGIQLTTSDDWANMTRLSLEDTFNTYGLNLVVDENDVAHASWMEQRPTELWVPYYTNSATGWNLVRIPGTIEGGGCSEGSSVAGAGQVDLFYDTCTQSIDRWTTTDGLQFARTEVPNNDLPTSVSAARDGAGNLYVASERYTIPFEDQHSSLQTSADGWIPHKFGPGRFPALAVTPTGELHVLRWSSDDESTVGTRFLYSNSLRGFETWTELPSTLSYFAQDVLPLVLETTRHRMFAAVPGADGIQLCSSLYTGRAVDTGASWTCGSVGDGDAVGPDLALAQDGTLHLAWSDDNGLGYANSLGSFLATNFTPRVKFGALSRATSTAIVPTAISDPDRDRLSGNVYVGRYQHVRSLVEPDKTARLLQGQHTIGNANNLYLYDPGNRLQFRVSGGNASWESYFYRTGLSALPAIVEVRRSSGETVGSFIIVAWDGTGATISQIDFVPYVTVPYSGSLPHAIDISTLPDGDTVLAVSVSDGSTSGFGAQAFTKMYGQVRLQLR